MSKFCISHILLLSLAVFISCGSNKDEKEIETTLNQFATHYFGCHYAEAINLCTKNSERYIRFTASNVSDSDLVVLNATQDQMQFETFAVEISDDSTAVATLKANNILDMSKIGASATVTKQAFYRFKLKCQEGVWKVDLNTIPAPIRQKE